MGTWFSGITSLSHVPVISEGREFDSPSVHFFLASSHFNSLVFFVLRSSVSTENDSFFPTVSIGGVFFLRNLELNCHRKRKRKSTRTSL